VYEYLGQRFGLEAHKTGAILFIISRLLGSALRMYIVIFVLQIFVFDAWNIPIWLTSIIFILIISAYTFKGGIKTVVWTDILQTTFMIAALVITIVVIFNAMNISFGEIWQKMEVAGYTKLWETDWRAHNFFIKHIIGGMFITIVMTGLDQDMMQKNLSCKTLKDAQKNMFTFTGILVPVNALFLLLGGMLLVFAQHTGIDLSGMPTDRFYPEIAFQYLGIVIPLVFVVGLIAAGLSSADGTFTALTTSVCYDLLKIEKRYPSEKKRRRVRHGVHTLIALLFLSVIIIFSNYHNDALIRIIFKVAGYTYGPILGLFAFGLFTKRTLRRPASISIIAISVPVVCYFLSKFSQSLLFGYTFGFEMIIVNGVLVFAAMYLLSSKVKREV